MKNLLLTLCLFTTCKAMAFDTWWHAECTRKAMTGNGFSADARLAAQVSNYITDFHSAVLFGTGIPEKQRVEVFKLKQEMSYEYMHFDAIYSTADIEKNWQSIYVNTIQTLKKYNNNHIHYLTKVQFLPGMERIAPTGKVFIYIQEHILTVRLKVKKIIQN